MISESDIAARAHYLFQQACQRCNMAQKSAQHRNLTAGIEICFSTGFFLYSAGGLAARISLLFRAGVAAKASPHDGGCAIEI